MAYIISVNASIVSDSGGTCACPRTAQDPTCDKDQSYLLCIQDIKQDLVTATAAISALACIAMGVFANLPVALAPGMGLNAYFAYTVVGRHGTGPIPYRVALTAIFVEGWIFLGLALLGLRQWLARAIPHSIKVATGVGIGLYLTLIGLTYGQGIGLVVGGGALAGTPLELAGCSPGNRRPQDGTCPGWDKMRAPTLWLGLFCGGILTVVLTMFRCRGAIILGVLLVSAVSWPRATPVTCFPDTDVGDAQFAFFRQVVALHPISGRTLGVQDWDVAAHGNAGQFALALATFLYVDVLDATGTLYSMARFAGLVDPATHDFEGAAVAYVVDALCISAGALLGVPPVTAFVESGAGIAEGAKTGLAAVVTGLCFLVAVFFAPVFASIPPWATGCVLVLVGAMMVRAVSDINWRYMGDAVPAFLAICLMPFTYSIADGLIGGIASHVLINGAVWGIKTLSRGRLVPLDEEHREGRTWRVRGGLLPPWLVRLASGRTRFWTDAEGTSKEASGERMSSEG